MDFFHSLKSSFPPFMPSTANKSTKYFLNPDRGLSPAPTSKANLQCLMLNDETQVVGNEK